MRMQGVGKNGTGIHETGPKGERDRQASLTAYYKMTAFFKERPVSEVTIAKMSNMDLYRLAEDLYNRQPMKRKNEYAVALGIIKRQGPMRFSTFASYYLAVKAPLRGDYRRAFYALQAPIRYFMYRQAEKAKAAAEKAATPAAQNTQAAQLWPKGAAAK